MSGGLLVGASNVISVAGAATLLVVANVVGALVVAVASVVGVVGLSLATGGAVPKVMGGTLAVPPVHPVP
ncbi:MAG: hypothetical protein WCO88_16725, partial [Actinomycetota bacterium]